MMMKCEKPAEFIAPRRRRQARCSASFSDGLHGACRIPHALTPVVEGSLNERTEVLNPPLRTVP